MAKKMENKVKLRKEWGGKHKGKRVSGRGGSENRKITLWKLNFFR